MSDAPFSLRANLSARPYFLQATPHILENLVARCQARTYAIGESIMFEGGACAGIYLIEQGRVKIYKLNPDGQEHVLHILGDGQTFNDIACFDGGANPANATALSDCMIWLIPSLTLREAMTQDSQIALNVIRFLSARVRGLVSQIEDLALYSVPVRLARFLLKQLDDPALSGLGVTRTTIASHIATTPQTISNVLKTFEELGAIRFNRHEVIVINEALLRSIAML